MPNPERKNKRADVAELVQRAHKLEEEAKSASSPEETEALRRKASELHEEIRDFRKKH
jgi:HPt (histidine-containing phosphotransfer) domain-containing protein